MTPCPFCQLITTPPPKTTFLQTPFVIGVLDIQPLISSDAHLLLIPVGSTKNTDIGAITTTHAQTLDEVDPITAGHLGYWLAMTVRALKNIILRARSVDNSNASSEPVAINVVQNNGAGAGQVVDHVHFHIILRQSATTDPRTRFLLEHKLYHPRPEPISKTNNNSITVDRKYGIDWFRLRNRLSYYEQVYGRGPREDLDEDAEWNLELVAALQKELKKIHTLNEKTKPKM